MQRYEKFTDNETETVREYSSYMVRSIAASDTGNFALALALAKASLLQDRKLERDNTGVVTRTTQRIKALSFILRIQDLPEEELKKTLTATDLEILTNVVNILDKAKLPILALKCLEAMRLNLLNAGRSREVVATCHRIAGMTAYYRREIEKAGHTQKKTAPSTVLPSGLKVRRKS